MLELRRYGLAMAIPAFNEFGWLPEGVHDCTVEEVAARFGAFHGTDRRPQLFARLVAFLREARASALLEAVLVDGSFVTAKPDPNDIDLVLVVPQNHDFSADLPAPQYNLLAQQRVRSRFGFDIVVVRNRSENLEQAVAFFQQVRQRPGLKKGILRIRL
jgi:hypothetical protein